MRVALVVALKDLRLRLRDRSALIIAFVAPTVLATIVTGAFGQSGFGPGDLKVQVLVADEDTSAVSRAFVDQVLGSDQLKEILLTEKVSSGAEARKRVTDDGAPAAIVVPKNFQSRVQSGARARLVVYRDAASPIAGDIVEAVATAFTEQVEASRLSVITAVQARGGDLGGISELAAAAGRERMPVQVADSGAAPARDVSGANYFGPAMAIFFLFFIVGTGARSLIAERELGTLPRILAAPAGRGSVVFGKALAIFVLGIASMTSVYLIMGLLFGVDWGDPLAIGALTLGAVASVMAITAVVQTLARTEQQAANYGQVVGMVLALLGGSFFPLFQMPAVIQRLSVLTPNGWAIRGFTDVAYDGAGVADLAPNLAVMAAFAVVCGGIASVRAKRIAVR